MERINKKNLRKDKLEKEQKKKQKNIMYFILAVVIVILATIFVYKRNNITYHSFKIDEGADWAISSYNQYLPYKNGILKYNKDGAEAIASNGTLIWNVSYNMKDPIAEVCGSYAVIADRGGRDIVIVNGTDTPNYLTLIHDISQVSISERGITAVMTDNGLENILYIYTIYSIDQDNHAANGSTNVMGSGYPLDLAISPDGKKTATSYLNVHEDVISTWTVFHNFGEVGQNYADKMVGGSNDGFVSRLYFLNTEIVLGCKENGFILYNIPEILDPDPVTVIVNEAILRMVYSDSMICIVTKNNDDKGRQKVYCYNLKGKRVSEFYTQEKYEQVMTSGDDIVFYNKTSFCIYDKNGIIKMQGEFDKSYEYIYPVNDTDKYLLIGEGYMDILKLLSSEK